MISEMRGLFLELDPLDSGRVPYTRLQQELEVGWRRKKPMHSTEAWGATGDHPCALCTSCVPCKHWLPAGNAC